MVTANWDVIWGGDPQVVTTVWVMEKRVGGARGWGGAGGMRAQLTYASKLGSLIGVPREEYKLQTPESDTNPTQMGLEEQEEAQEIGVWIPEGVEKMVLSEP